MSIPSYLEGYEGFYEESPRGAGLQWFREAKYGLFLHYGLYSLLGRDEWVMFRERIPVREYEKLKDDFTAERFDAEFIAELALEAGMRYVNITTKHHDGFCLWDTGQTEFKSTNSPAKRDLVRELAEACQKRGLGLFCYYSHGRDWRHPHAPNNDEWGGNARPPYETSEPSYAYRSEHDLDKYLDFVSAQITELLTNYGAIAGIWLDGVGVPLSGDRAKFNCHELYELIHSLQPQTLISYKEGLIGEEDFLAPENKPVQSAGRPVEICTTMCPGSWGYLKEGSGKHRTADDVWELLRDCRRWNANLLLNTGPLPDGSIDPEDEPVLRAVGSRLRREGFRE